MQSANSQELSKMRRIATWYNQSINFFWSFLNFAPIGYFIYSLMSPDWLYTFLTISVLAGFLPNSFFDFIQVSKTTTSYNKLGIRIVKKYTQDGDLINRLIRKKFPHYKPVRVVSINQYVGKTYVNEKFHFVAFLFFLFTGLYAIAQGHWWWGAVIGINNLIFNVYPIFLQQYNRIRFRQLLQRTSPNL